ncbi:hypothetical protein PYW08_012353 [Mythimna loreyi]|uniref:Uncharacterized protein n=1 Tax=Mythimna loreyi TaxID=667449 RepID=A0ACC2Q0T5_9NEOP|nr:hypothetical protein PYW08_012353 [Mythimna loreyi]
MGDNCKPQSPARRSFSGLPGPLGQGEHADSFSVARVRPRTSKGITDLLLLNLVRLEAAGPSKKNFNTSPMYRPSQTTRLAVSSNRITRELYGDERCRHVATLHAWNETPCARRYYRPRTASAQPRSTDSRATTVHAKPFSTSVLQGLAGVFATTTKICTDGGSKRAHAQTLLRSPPRTSYSLRLNDVTMNVAHAPLDGVYHPLRAALSSNPTLRRVPLAAILRRYGPGTLYGKTAPFKTNLDRSDRDEKAEPPEHHISRRLNNGGIQCWASFLFARRY